MVNFYIITDNSRLFHISLALHYGNIALNTFNQNIDYIRGIECQIIIAINYIRIEHFDKAEFFLLNALKISEKFNDTYLISNIYHNLGFLYSRINNHNLAIEFYHKSLKYKEDDYEGYTNTIYYLIQEYLKLKNRDKVIEWGEKGIIIAEENKIEKASIIIKILLLQQDDDKSILRKYLEEIAIPFFKKKQYWNDVSNYAELLADDYANQFQYKLSSQLYKLANDAKKKIQK